MTPFEFKMENRDMADITTLPFHNQFHAYLAQCDMHIKPFLELGPDVEDYYKPSSPHVSQEEMMQE